MAPKIVIVKNIFVSIDPYQLNRMKAESASQKASIALAAISPGQVDLLKEKLVFDDAFNYNEEPDLNSALRRYFPDGIDIYFDNVGGEMLQAAIANINTFGRIAACCAISEYTDKNKHPRIDMLDVTYKRITISGYLSLDFAYLHPKFVSVTAEHLQHGIMHAVEDISHGIENVSSAFLELYEGVNVGKKLVQVDQI